MPPKFKRSLKGICREIGVPHLQVTEVLRRITNYVSADEEVITQEVGTFYLKKSKATTKKNYGIDYAVPARQAVALRGPRFPGGELSYPEIAFMEFSVVVGAGNGTAYSFKTLGPVSGVQNEKSTILLTGNPSNHQSQWEVDIRALVTGEGPDSFELETEATMSYVQTIVDPGLGEQFVDGTFTPVATASSPSGGQLVGFRDVNVNTTGNVIIGQLRNNPPNLGGGDGGGYSVAIGWT